MIIFHNGLIRNSSASLSPMAASFSLLPAIDLHHHHKHLCLSSIKPPYFGLTHKRNHRPSPINLSFRNGSLLHTHLPSSSSSSFTDFKSTRFLTNQEFETLNFLQNFTYSIKLPSGYLTIRPMNPNELDSTTELLAESFSESMFLSNAYLPLLGFLIRQYLIERRSLIPHCVTLLGFYREDEDDELGGTVEVSFDRKGANSSPPTPTPPKNCAYICNMTVKKSLRRRGIGWHLLKASEELISRMSSSKEVYLHCRMIDSAPFNMYKKAGYNVVTTDSILVFLTLQRRKHLMCKKLPSLTNSSEMAIGRDEEETSSEMENEESEHFCS